MKRCPTCQAAYPDEAPDFCPNDGMRLVREQAAPAFDPEKTVLSSTRQAENEAAQAAPAPPRPPARPQPERPPVERPQTPAPAPSPQQNSPQQQPPGFQPAQPAGWPNASQPQAQPPSPQPQQPAAQQWGQHLHPQQQNAQFAPQYPQAQGGRRRAFSIAAIVFGASAASLMVVRVGRSEELLNILMLIFSILGIALGAAALFFALRNSSRFAGVELAIGGLALGVAGLVYVLLN